MNAPPRLDGDGRETQIQRRRNEVISDRLSRLRKQLARNNQKGFTLIELLVVISILGILAAVVTMSLVGITSTAQSRAAAAEKSTVQTAYDSMLADQQVPGGHECDGAPTGAPGTNNMLAFPTGATYQSTTDTVTNAQVTVPQHVPVALAPHYLREQTHGFYYCGTNGEIQQASYAP